MTQTDSWTNPLVGLKWRAFSSIQGISWAKNVLKRPTSLAKVLCVVLAFACVPIGRADDQNGPGLDPDEVLRGLRTFYASTGRDDGSFRPGIDPDYRGISDSASSDLAAVTYACTIHKTFGWKLPHEEQTIALLLGRQRASGEFVNAVGTLDPASPQGRVYNTTQALVALHALGVKPRFDPLPVFAEILKQDYKTLPAYSTSFFPLAYLCAGQPIPAQADRAIRAMMIQDDDGYLIDHVAATFHASHYYALVGDPTPKAPQIVDRILRDQNASGNWFTNLPARDRHATFDAVFTLRHEGADREDCRLAIARAAEWALSCRNVDGGFGHYPGSTSDADAVYFQVGTLVMARCLQPADPLPQNPELLSWGHLMPVRQRPSGQRQLLLPHPGWVGSVAISDDALTVVTGCSDHQVRLWNRESGKSRVFPKHHRDVVSSVALAATDELLLLVSGSFDRTALIWNVVKGDVRHTLRGHRGAVLSVACSRQRKVATASIDRTILLWDLASGERLRTLTGHKSWVNSVAFSRDGQRLISGSSDGTVKIWSTGSGKLEQTLPASDAEVRSIAISPDGRWIAAGIRYGAVSVWSAGDWTKLHAWTVSGDDVGGIAFTPDNRSLLIATGEWNRPGRVEIWDVAAANKTDILAHTGEALCVAVSSDGKTIAAGGGDKAVSVWNVSDRTKR